MKITKPFLFMGILTSLLLMGCVNQHPEIKIEDMDSSKPRIIATSVATSELTALLNIPLVGVANTNVYTIPSMYDKVKRIGMPMSPNMEIIKSLKPTEVLSPKSLENDLRSRYDEIQVPYTFLNLSSVQGLYESMEVLGKKYDKEDHAAKLVKEYQEFMASYKQRHAGKTQPKILVLMGLPGSYVIATNKSYIGNLLELAGGDNIYQHDTDEFLAVNPEDLMKQNPEAIFRAAHAMPEEVMEQFDEEFSNNDIWKHFDAVKKNRVYNLDHRLFNMSANMRYQEALESVENQLYPQK